MSNTLFDEAVDLDVLGDVVGRVDVDDRVAGERLVVVGLVAEEDLVAGRNEVGAELPLRRQPVVEAGLEAVARHARQARARHDIDAVAGSGLPGMHSKPLGLSGDDSTLAVWKVASM